jgi:hypothetical protein
MRLSRRLEEVVGSWPHISVHTHRFGGREFLLGTAEVGHVHENGIVDIPFPRPLRDALLAENLAVEHHWVPDSGWVTFQVRSAEDFDHAVCLMRLSYLRYALKTAVALRELLDQQSAELRLTQRIKSLFEPFVPQGAAQLLNQTLAT